MEVHDNGFYWADRGARVIHTYIFFLKKIHHTHSFNSQTKTHFTHFWLGNYIKSNEISYIKRFSKKKFEKMSRGEFEKMNRPFFTKKGITNIKSDKAIV